MPTSSRDLQSVSNEMSTGRKRTKEQDRKRWTTSKTSFPTHVNGNKMVLSEALQGGSKFQDYISLCTVSASQDHCLFGFFLILYLLFYLPFPAPYHCEHFCLGNIRANREGSETRESHRRDCFGGAVQGCLTNPSHTRY